MMCRKNFNKHLAFLAFILLLQTTKVASYKRNYEAKYTKANVPLWKQRACEKAQIYKANSHYICDDTGDVKCLPGWQGDLCQVPMCRKGCDPMNGYCQRPGECRCRIGYTGELCDKCIPLPGCQHGDCTKPFECICRPGWDGLFCTEPTCRQGCHNTRGYCETPGECRCRIGWAGRNCSDCSVLPGCQHGTCAKPLECQCLAGYTGLLCQTPICHADCHKQHGYCKRPGECRCKVGWTGANCDKCFAYPGCVHGDCEKPWECNCKSGWGGILCDEELTYCKQHPNTCENKGKCISLTKEDGSYRCKCKQGFLGKNCEIIDEFLLTSTMPPRITPPTLTDLSEEEEEEEGEEEEDGDNELQSSLSLKVKEKDLLKLTINDTQYKNESLNEVIGINILQAENIIANSNVTKSVEAITTLNGTTPLSNLVKTAKDNDSVNQTVGGINLNTSTIEVNILHSNKTRKATNSNHNLIALINSTAAYNTSINFTKPAIPSTTSTTISPLSKLDDEKNLHNMPLQPIATNKNKLQQQEAEEDDEECTDDNDDECEYVDEDEEDDDDDDDD